MRLAIEGIGETCTKIFEMAESEGITPLAAAERLAHEILAQVG